MLVFSLGLANLASAQGGDKDKDNGKDKDKDPGSEKPTRALVVYTGSPRIPGASPGWTGGGIILPGSTEWDKTLKYLEGDQDGPPPLPSSPQPPEIKNPRSYVEDFSKRLSSRVIEQPELVSAFADIELSTALSGTNYRSLPELVYLMGTPGTGKDTGTEAYVDEIYQYRNAHREHLFRLPIAKKEADLWKLFGSNTGYIGSSDLSPLVRWLVKHSGGRYQIVEEQGEKKGPGSSGAYVVENPSWDPKAAPADGTFAPEHAVLFANEFHNWSRSAKDLLLKQAIEKGYFPINNPGKGVSELYVPVTIVIASNEGIELVTSRKPSGERYGRRLSYDEMLAKWERVHADKKRLKEAIIATNGKTLDTGSETAGGASEELVNRIPNSRMILMRPLSVDGLRRITQGKLFQLRQDFQKVRKDFGPIDIQWGPELVDYIARYEYDPEEGARPLSDRIYKLIRQTLYDAIMNGSIDPATSQKSFRLQIKPLPDGTALLEFLDAQSAELKFSLPIRATESNRPPEPVSDQRIEHLVSRAGDLVKQVFGIEPIADRLNRAVLVGENVQQAAAEDAKAARPARTFMFLGLSSTGKTETAKAVARVYFDGEHSLKVIDFGQIRTIEDLKQKILGSKDSLGRVTPSEFMMEYDRLDGKALFVFDEIANAPKEVLKALYDVLREAEVTTFADGKPRNMRGVMIVMTGNAGEEWFRDIPTNIPVVERQAAMEEVYQRMMEDPAQTRAFLRAYFSDALLNRIGMNNIFFFAPTSARTLRQLADLKLSQALERLEGGPGRRGWKIRFESEADYRQVLEFIEREGFVIDEQGASIDRYIKQEFEEALQYKLLKGQVPSGSEVILKPGTLELSEPGKKPASLPLKIIASGKSTGSSSALDVVLPGSKHPREIKHTDEARIFTAYHEAGHELVRQALLGDKYRSDLITIVPGVTQIGGRWIRYAGLARSEDVEALVWTRKSVIYEMAVLAAGESAQEIVSNLSDAGKSNDFQRASDLAREAILRWGLSPGWGNELAGKDVDLTQYVTSLSEERRKAYEKELNQMLSEARTLAKRVLLANFESHFVPMAVELARKGTLKSEDLAEIYKKAPQELLNPDQKPIESLWRSLTLPRIKLTLARLVHSKAERDATLLSQAKRPEQVADLNRMLEERREAAVNSVELHAAKWVRASGAVNCGKLFERVSF